MDENGTVREETLLRVSHSDSVDPREIESLLDRAIEEHPSEPNDT
jgi:hypothetical protein